jgi:hypothetical protein
VLRDESIALSGLPQHQLCRQRFRSRPRNGHRLCFASRASDDGFGIQSGNAIQNGESASKKRSKFARHFGQEGFFLRIISVHGDDLEETIEPLIAEDYTSRVTMSIDLVTSQ